MLILVTDYDPFWEATDEELRGLVTTQNGYLLLDPHILSVRGHRIGAQTGSLLKQRTSSCLDGGFIEVSVVSPSSSQDKHLMVSEIACSEMNTRISYVVV